MKQQKNHSAQQVFAFIDSQNLNVSVQKLGWKVDWQKFRDFLRKQYGVTEAFMFIGYVPEFEDMYDQLHETGYSIVLKQTFDMTRPQAELLDEADKKTLDMKDKPDDEEKKPVKGNVDADLVLWAMKELPRYDKAIIVSGDGDFFSLVEYLESQHKLLKILTPNSHYSSLYNRYDSFVERIDEHKKQLAYRDRRRFPRKNN